MLVYWAYNRISDMPCSVHSNIYQPDFVVVVDETLLQAVDVTKGLSSEGAIVINSARAPHMLRPMLNGYEGRVYTIDARKVSEACLGRYFPNTPMLAAIVHVSHVVALILPSPPSRMRGNKKPAPFCKRASAACNRCTTCYCILTYALRIMGETVMAYCSQKRFGLKLGSDFPFRRTATGLAPSPARCGVPTGSTFSIIAVHRICSIV